MKNHAQSVTGAAVSAALLFCVTVSASADTIARVGPAGNDALLDLASVQIDAGKCREAQATMSRYFAQETNPGVDAWLLAGFAAKECGDPAKALELYNRGLARHARDPLLLHNIGQIHFSQNDYAKAENAWSGIGESHQDPQLLYKRAIAARFQRDLPAAERHIRRAVAMDENAEFCDLLGVLLYAKGDIKGAEENFRRALKIDPNNMSAQLNLAISGKNADAADNAVADAAKRLSSCKGKACVDAALQLSVLQYRQKKPEQAVSTLESVREPDRDLRVYRYLAVYNRELRRNDKAVAALETAAKRFGSDLKIQYELAEAYLSSGNPSRAVKIFTELLPKWKNDVWRLHYQLGYAYMEQNDLTNAKASFEKSMSAKSENPAARALLAFVLNRMGQRDKAVEHWERTVREDGNNAAIHINLGLSYEARGEYERALQSYRQAIAIDPSDKAVHINIGNAYQGLERIPEAFQAFTAGLESNKRDLAAYNIFLLSRTKGDNARAEKMYELLRKEFPSSVQTTRVTAETDLSRGDTAKALAAFEAIRAKDADDWYAIARIQSQRGQRQSAERALANLPDDSRWAREKELIRARLAFNAGDFQGAYRMYRNVIGGASGRQARGGADHNIYNLILAAWSGGMHREALTASRELAQRTQGRTRIEICRVAGNSALALKEWPEAKNWYAQLTTLEPNNAVNHYNLAVALFNLGEIEEGYKRYGRAREMDGKIRNADIETRYEQFRQAVTAAQTATAARRYRDSLDTWYNEAVGLQNARQDTLAESLYKRILGVDAAYSLAWNNLGAIYGMRGELEAAEAAYAKALENQPAPETFANLANIYIAMEEIAKAKETIAKGLTNNPGDPLLKRMERTVRTME